MRIAVIGTGISGNLAARLLSTAHQVDVYESESHIGGHAHTIDTRAYGVDVSVDVAFMVLNRRTYPNFCRMLDILGVETQESDMSLSVRCLKSGLEYQGSSLNGLFAQRRNLFRPAFYRMLRDINRFNRRAFAYCARVEKSMLLGDFLDALEVGSEFRDHYLIPMSAAIWSTDPDRLQRFPAEFILGFLRNHGLLQMRDRPQWLTVAERSSQYVTKLIRPIRDRVHLNTSAEQVCRRGDGVRVTFSNHESTDYDHVVLASHADQSLSLLVDASEAEREVLKGFPYQSNTAVLHTDESVLPRARRAWASWNCHVPRSSAHQVSVTYDLNRLQRLGLPGPLCLTLNPGLEIDSDKILNRFHFTHPVFSKASINSQQRYEEINGIRGVSFCGAYWGYGFHEDGVNSALAVARFFGLSMEDLSNPAQSPRRQSTLDSQSSFLDSASSLATGQAQ